MTPAACLYVGRTHHARMAPQRHKFAYRIASLLIDVDRLDEAGRLSRLFSIDRFNVFSFFRRDHAERSDAPLGPWARQQLSSAGVDLEGGQVTLLAFPRVLGYVFNPLSVWFGYGPDGQLRGVIYEVHNTFGDSHAYVTRIEPPERDATRNVGPLQHDSGKRFHVSPFFPVDGRYAFSLAPPGDTLSLSIRYERNDAPVFVANQTGTRRALTSAALVRVFFGQPLMTLKVIAGIHFEAARLFLKGAKYHRRPKPVSSVTIAQSRTVASPNAAE